jgi:hypothetical protein
VIIELTQLNFKLPNGAELGKNGPLGPTFFSLTPNLIFCALNPNAKFQNPMTTPSLRKVNQGERKRKTPQ